MLTNESLHYSHGVFDYCPWLFTRSASNEERKEQLEWQAEIANRMDAEFGNEAFVSRLSAIYADRLRIGARSFIAAHAYLTHDVVLGDDCSVNVYATVRGKTRIGNGVRIGAHTSLLGFNHSFAPERPVYTQPTVSKGITVGDDVWIGSHVVVLDGVHVGSHAVIGAGAVVVRDVPDWAIVAGNPAKPIGDRRRRVSRQGGSSLGTQLAEFSDRTRAQADELLRRYWSDGSSELGGHYVDQPGMDPSVRALCDAVEIADLLIDRPPPHMQQGNLVQYLRSLQDPATGLVLSFGQTWPITLENSAYNLLCVGYALRVLGDVFEHPIRLVADMDPNELTRRLDGLNWSRAAWKAGSWIDTVGTGLWLNRIDFGLAGPVEQLFGWLLLKADPWHGMWGQPDVAKRWGQVVNGFYRATRGTFAQFGLPLPYPERAIDTILVHAHDSGYFTDVRGNACDVLDVIHPLWLLGAQASYRREEAVTWVR